MLEVLWPHPTFIEAVVSSGECKASSSEMERGSHDRSVTAQSTSRGGDEKDKDIASSHRLNESEDEELPGHETESVETISVSWTSPRRPKDSGSNRKKTGRYFTDYSYLNSLSKQERRRIEGEMIKGCKPGENKLDTQPTHGWHS